MKEFLLELKQAWIEQNPTNTHNYVTWRGFFIKYISLIPDSKGAYH